MYDHNVQYNFSPIPKGVTKKMIIIDRRKWPSGKVVGLVTKRLPVRFTDAATVADITPLSKVIVYFSIRVSSHKSQCDTHDDMGNHLG